MASVSEDIVHKQSFSIDDLSTRSVTIYPARAAVVRDIENVVIKTGRNEITLHNLTHHADEHSIKVEGHGTSALITDMTVDLVPNFRFSDSGSNSEDESDDEPPKNAELEKLVEEIKILRLQLDDADESRASAMKQLNYLDQLTATLSTSTGGTVAATVVSVQQMSENLDSYSGHREKIYTAFKEAQATCSKLTEELNKKLEKKLKVQTSWEKSLVKPNKAKQQRARQRAHERFERQEQQLEMPRFVYRIKITIESESLPEDTPVVIASIATGKPAKKEDDEPPSGSKGPSLRISYITGGASWKPRYDLRLDTISGTGVLTYRAHFFNRTGEIWRDAKITLSTSQTAFSGLEDKVPWMDSWVISLRKRSGHSVDKDGGLYSNKERQLKEKRLKKRKEESIEKKPAVKPTIGHFPPSKNLGAIMANPASLPAPPPLIKFGSSKEIAYHPTSPRYTPTSPPYTAYARGENLPVISCSGNRTIESCNRVPQNLSTEAQSYVSLAYPGEGGLRRKSSVLSKSASKGFGGGLFGGGLSTPPIRSESIVRDRSDDDPDSDASDDTVTLNPPQKMGLAASGSESYGLTTTYELPGLRTIPPSKLLRRHVISEINLPHVEFSHIAVPKLRAEAFLKARVRNPSKTPLLRGPAGLTLDGSFLGNSTLPRCAPDEHFELGLGVDEEVLIQYRKPVRRTASQGVLVREQVLTYERCVRIHNARGNPVKLVIFDQVPVSEDERLKVSISKPRGLKGVGDILKVSGDGSSFVNAGYTAVGTAKNPGVTAAGTQGYVQAEVRKGGEIRWEVSIEAGKDAVLPLEYEAKLPSAEVIYQI